MTVAPKATAVSAKAYAPFGSSLYAMQQKNPVPCNALDVFFRAQGLRLCALLATGLVGYARKNILDVYCCSGGAADKGNRETAATVDSRGSS